MAYPCPIYELCGAKLTVEYQDITPKKYCWHAIRPKASHKEQGGAEALGFQSASPVLHCT